MREKQFVIWVGAVLLLAMLATAYIAVDAIYHASEAPYLPQDYIETVLVPPSDEGLQES